MPFDYLLLLLTSIQAMDSCLVVELLCLATSMYLLGRKF